MNSKILMITKILLGLFVLFFGLNKLIPGGIIEMPPPEGDALVYFTGLIKSNTLTLVALVEVIAGLALIFNKFAALFALILMSISVNAVLFHATLDPEGIGGAIVLIVLNILVLYGYKDKYASLLN